jgi:hypothetical protein
MAKTGLPQTRCLLQQNETKIASACRRKPATNLVQQSLQTNDSVESRLVECNKNHVCETIITTSTFVIIQPRYSQHGLSNENACSVTITYKINHTIHRNSVNASLSFNVRTCFSQSFTSTMQCRNVENKACKCNDSTSEYF